MNIGSKTLIEKRPSLSDLRYKAKRIPLTALGRLNLFVVGRVRV